MKKFVAMMIALMLVLSTAAMAETTVFKMGIDPEYNPYTYIDETTGDYVGFDVEMCKAVCDILGWEQEIVPINWDTKLVQLDAGEVDCIWSGLTIDVIDPDEYSLSFPYVNNTQVIVTKADSGITSAEDLAGKVVSLQLGTSADILVSEGGDQADLGATFADIVRTQSYNLAFTELAAGSADAMIVDSNIASTLIGDETDKYVILEGNLSSEVYGICFRKADEEMCLQVERAYATLVEDGTYAALGEKYDVDPGQLCLLEGLEEAAEPEEAAEAETAA